MYNELFPTFQRLSTTNPRLNAIYQNPSLLREEILFSRDNWCDSILCELAQCGVSVVMLTNLLRIASSPQDFATILQNQLKNKFTPMLMRSTPSQQLFDLYLTAVIEFKTANLFYFQEENDDRADEERSEQEFVPVSVSDPSVQLVLASFDEKVWEYFLNRLNARDDGDSIEKVK